MKRSQVEPVIGDGGGRIAGVADGVLGEQLVSRTGFDDDNFSGLFDAVELAVDADRRAAEVAPDSLLPDGLTGLGIEAVDDAVVVPEEEQFTDTGHRGDIGQLFLATNLDVSLTDIAVAGRIDADQPRPFASLTTGGEDESVRKRGGRDRPLWQFPRRPIDLARPRIEARQTRGPREADELRLLAFGLDQQRTRIRRFAGSTQGTPDDSAGSTITGDDGARSILIVGKDHQIFKDEWRGTLSVLADKRTEPCAPRQLSIKVIGGEGETFLIGERHVDVLSVRGWCPGSKTVFGVLAVGVVARRARPLDLTRDRVETAQVTNQPTVGGCRHEEVLIPNNG